jgi:rare lipoprotein A
MIRTILSLLLLVGLLMPVTSAYAQASKVEYGKAAYYADRLHGRKTASGRLYDKNKYTCAHKTQPFGTKLRVTRLDNNKSVIVEVTDRGPFKDGFSVDLSRRAAEDLNMIQDGVVRVKIEVVGADEAITEVASPTPVEPSEFRVISSHTPTTDGVSAVVKPVTHSTPNTSSKKGNISPKAGTVSAPGSSTPDLSAPVLATPTAVSEPTGTELYQASMSKPAKQGYAVQCAALSSAQGAMDEAARLNAKWPGKILILVSGEGNNALYKILIGAYATKADATKAQSSAVKNGFKRAYVVDLSTL